VEDVLKRFSVFLLFALIGLTLGLYSADMRGMLRAAPMAMTSATGGFLAGEEAMGVLDTGSASQLLSNSSWQRPGNALLVLRTFHAQAANGEIEAAAKTASRLLDLVPNDEVSKLLVGAVALKKHQYSQAIEALNGVEARSFIGITAAIVKGWAHIGENRYGEAKAVLDSLSEGDIEDFLTYHRALMADVAGRRDEALDYARKAYESEPFDVRFLGAYVRMLANDAQFAEAERIIKLYRDQGLTDPSVLGLEKLVRAGQRPGKLTPDVQTGAAEMFNSVGGALSHDGTADLAAIYLRIALYLSPDFDLAAMELAGLYAAKSRYEAADALYASLPGSSLYKKQGEVRRAQALDSSGHRDQAIDQLHAMVVADPDNLDAVVALADMLRAAERYEEASDTYSIAIGLIGGTHPQDWRYYYLRGMCYERAKQWPQAERDFLTALDLNPGNPQVLNYLGYSWIDQGVRLDEALGMIKKALEWDPSDGYVVDSLGWAYYRLGRYEEAVHTLEQAVQLRASDPAINDHLGDAYWRAGRKLEAKFQWSIASDLDPESDIGKQASEKLGKGLEAADPPSNS
jgi:tetratricopeptide (TPR) repeat protein